ncbi:thioesterase [Ruminiclostridium cellobioparum]|uniref:thioesterase n=1 Tax=Ruminiclostridium cellobioparum TaxID=29355 RepID=UPI0013F3A2FE
MFCLPHAGGNSTLYFPWRKLLHPNIRLISIELAGRGKRAEIQFYSSIEAAVNDVYSQIEEYLFEAPFAIFGHSMGGLIAFELAHKLMDVGVNELVHLFISGKYPPHIEKYSTPIHSLPDAEFITEVSKLGGIPQGIHKYKPILNLYLPILKSDYKIVETYKYEHKSRKLDCCITALNGRKDKLTSEIQGWEAYTNNKFQMIEFEGGHFYINNQLESILNVINNTLVI